MTVARRRTRARRPPNRLSDVNWVTIATYEFWPDADIARGRLRVEGVEAQLADQHLVQTDWLYSIAVGGIKLRVAPHDVDRAREILDHYYSGELDPPE